jgi:hypothetical protein
MDDLIPAAERVDAEHSNDNVVVVVTNTDDDVPDPESLIYCNEDDEIHVATSRDNDNDNDNDNGHWTNERKYRLRELHGYCVHCNDDDRIPIRLYRYEQGLCHVESAEGECANGVCLKCCPEEQQTTSSFGDSEEAEEEQVLTAVVVVTTDMVTTTCTEATCTVVADATTSLDEEIEEDDGNEEEDEEEPLLEEIPLEFPKHGVTLSFLLEEFIEKDCKGGREALAGLTTTQVCEKYIKPKTRDKQSSYCDKLKEQGHPAYGPVASIFVSHAHQYEFLQVINALAWHMKRDESLSRHHHDTIIVWFDIFSINQHKPTQWTFDWLSTAFMSAIENFGRTVVILSPWYAPIPFARLWCIYEAYSTMVTGGVFEIAMSESDQKQFLQDVRDDPQRRVNQMLGTIRAEKAECFLEEDRENIFSAVQSSVGFGQINSMVFQKYRDWVLKVSIDAYKKCSDDVEQLEILSTIGLLYSGQGKHQQAEPYPKECWEKRKRLLGETHPDALKSMDQFVVHCTSVGRYGEGRILHEDCLTKRLAAFGENHVSALQSMDNLAFLHQCQGKSPLKRSTTIV